MLGQFLFVNIHFLISILGVLSFFATGWLHIDSWTIDKTKKNLLVRGLGFLLLSLVYAIHATTLTIPILVLTTSVVKIIGLFLILGSLVTEPVLSKPLTSALILFNPVLLATSLTPLTVILFIGITLIYLYKATKGLEKQIRLGGWAFLFLALAELTSSGFMWKDTELVFWSRFLANYGPLWIAAHTFELVGVIILGIWIWGYLRFRARVQLFVIFLTSSFTIFSVTTFVFTFLLLTNIKNYTLSHLTTDAKVLNLAIENIKFRALADSRAIAGSADVLKGVKGENKELLSTLVDEFQKEQQLSLINVYLESGQTLFSTGEDIEDEDIIKKALDRQTSSKIVKREGVTAPTIEILASAPIVDQDKDLILGVVVVGFVIDNAFVDGVKEVTGLTATVYGGDTRAATTILSPDGKTKFLGTKESSQEILDRVLERGETYIGESKINNQFYLASYIPIKENSNNVIGMLSVAKPQTDILNVADHSFKLTFIATVVMILSSILPSYLLSKYIKENLKA